MVPKRYKSIADVFDDTKAVEEMATRAIAEDSDDLLDQMAVYGPDDKRLRPKKEDREYFGGIDLRF